MTSLTIATEAFSSQGEEVHISIAGILRKFWYPIRHSNRLRKFGFKRTYFRR